MCGIFGYTGVPTDAATMVFTGLKKLEYRGYDSWGIAVGSDGAVHTARDVGKLTVAPIGLPEGGVALGHTRWATTGAVTEGNAHPHRDCSGRLALVHNGIIENYVPLRQGLIARGHTLRSETDSEVAAHLLEEELARMDAERDTGRADLPPEQANGHANGNGARLAEALRRVGQQLDGLNALAALDVTSGELAAVKNGSPLIVGIGTKESADGGNGKDSAQYLASDMAALLAHTRRLIYVRDGQVVSLRPEGVELFDAETGAPLPLDIEDVHWTPEEAELGAYHHYLEKEIWEQPALLRRVADEGVDAATELARFLGLQGELHLTGCGTAFHAALTGRYLLALEAGRPSLATYAHEFGPIAASLQPGDAVVAFSQSGETIDVLDAVRAARAHGAALGALVNVPGSTLTREVDLTLMLGAGPERSVLSTKTFTAKLAYLLLAAGALAGEPARHVPTLRAAADDIAALRADGRLDTVRDVAHHIADREHLFVLGRNVGYPLALEAALKIKEVTYMHAEGFAAGELKHGVIALVEPGTPVFVLAPSGADEAYMLTAAGEVKARGAYVVGIGPRHHAVYDAHIPVHAEGLAYLLAALPPLQLLAYELALLRGTDPDRPRNLAKSVTVR